MFILNKHLYGEEGVSAIGRKKKHVYLISVMNDANNKIPLFGFIFIKKKSSLLLKNNSHSIYVNYCICFTTTLLLIGKIQKKSLLREVLKTLLKLVKLRIYYIRCHHQSSKIVS